MLLKMIFLLYLLCILSVAYKSSGLDEPWIEPLEYWDTEFTDINILFEGNSRSSGLYPESSGFYPESSGLYPESSGLYPESSGLYPESPGLYHESSGLYPENSGLNSDSCRFNNRTCNFDYKKYGSLNGENCHCDDSCHEYQDCCLDKVDSNSHKSFGTLNQECLALPGNDFQSDLKIGIFMVNKCQSGWPEDKAKYFCESTMSLDEINNGSSYLAFILPIHSEETGKFYKNVYCAACNEDYVRLTNWTLLSSMTLSDECKFGEEQTIKPRNKYVAWPVIEERYCILHIEEFLYWRSFYEKFRPRPCLLDIISTCSDLSSPAAIYCPRYNAPVFLATGFWVASVKITYKNYHCAMCNHAKNKEGTLRCQNFRWYSIKTESGMAPGSLKVLFNFNFGNVHSVLGMPRCEKGHLYEPILKRCLFISHSRKQYRVSNKYSLLNCSTVTIYPTDYTTQKDKSLLIGGRKRVHPDQFKPNQLPNGTWVSVSVCSRNFFSINGFDDVQVILSGVSLSVSIVCLCLLLTVYAILPPLRNLPGKNLMSMSASLATAHGIFLLGIILEHGPSACYIIGVVTHYSYLAVFSWTNVMAFDIFLTFRGISVSRQSNTTKIYVKYSVYAWISPAVVVTMAVVTDVFIKIEKFKPLYGRDLCWISQKLPLMTFFAIPLAAILLANMILFVLTARRLRKTARETKMARRFSDKLRLVLYVKLAVVLGLTWIFGFVAAIVDVDLLWYPFILLTGLQGLFIFVAFTCKRKILNLLRRRFESKDVVGC